MKKESFFSSVKGLFCHSEPDDKQDKGGWEFKQNIWGMSGRSAQMQNRTLMQFKGFERK